MTQLLAPSLIGSAPPANAPPGLPPSTAPSGTGKDPTGAFASLLTEATSAMQGGETGSPPSGGTPSMLVDSSDAELLAGLAALMSQLLGANADGGTPETATDLSLLDRPAGAGETDTLDGTSALEALMAFLVVGQQHADQPAASPSMADIRDLLATAGDVVDVALASDGAMPDGTLTAGMLTAGGSTAATGSPADVLPAAVAAAFASMTEAYGATGVAGSDSGEPPTLAAMLAAFRATSQQAGGDAETPSGASDAAAALVQAPVPQSTASSVDGTAETQGQPVSDLAALTDSAMLAGDESGAGSRGLADANVSVEVRPADVADARLDARVDSAAAPGVGPPAMLASTGVDAPAPARVVNAATLPADIADTVQAAVLRGDSEVRLVLNPPELGHVEVRIASHEGGLRISLEAAQSGARDLMERSLPALQQALEARDLRVERLNVQATDTGRGSLDTSAGGPQSGGSDANSGDGGPEWSAVASFGGGTEAVTARPSQSQTADGRLDVMA